MAARTTPKTRRKVTQRELIENLFRAVAEFENNAKDRMSHLMKRMSDQEQFFRELRQSIEQRIDAQRHEQYALAQEAAAAPEPEVKEPHGFMEGDWVVVTGICGVTGRKHHVGAISKIQAWNTGHAKEAWFIDAIDAWFLPHNIRPATDLEISAHLEEEARKKQEAEWAAVRQLRAYDTCRCSMDEIRQLVSMAKAAGIKLLQDKDEFFESRMIGVYWFPHEGGDRLSALSHTDGEQDHPFAEFRRRLQGTIARLEAERKAAEEAKPIAPGAKLKWMDREGVYIAEEGGNHWIATKKPGRSSQIWSTEYVGRSEFTITPKP